MSFGAEPKKVAILGVLLVAAGYLFYSNILAPAGDDSTTSAAAPVVAPASLSPRPSNPAAPLNRGALPDAAREAEATNSRRGGRDASVQEFRPSLRPRGPEEHFDPSKIDPTLETYRLAKLKEVAVASGGRNVFEFGAAAAPLPNVPDFKILPKKPAAEFGPPKPPPPPPPPGPAPPPVKPQAPPIPWKYYGFAQKDFQQRAPTNGPRRGLFIRGGEEIFVANEGDLIERRYKVIRILANAATLEDTQFSQQQTIPIEQAPPGQ